MLFLQPLTAREKAHNDSWQNRFEEGIWIGTVSRTSETLIATPLGVFLAGQSNEKWCPSGGAFYSPTLIAANRLNQSRGAPTGRYQPMYARETLKRMDPRPAVPAADRL